MDLHTACKSYGVVEAHWIQERIRGFWDRHEDIYGYVDNTRLARVGDQVQEASFDEQDRSGCCGSANLSFGPSPGGHTYRYGFNHGH